MGRLAVLPLLLIASPLVAGPSPHLPVTPGFGKMDVMSHSLVWIDRDGTADLETVIAMADRGELEPVKSDSISLGVTDVAAWIAVPLRNAVAERVRYLLEIASPTLDYVDVHLPAPEGYRARLSGDQRPLAGRDREFRTFVFEVELAPLAAETVYIRVRTNGSFFVPVALWEESAFSRHVTFDHAIYAFFVGAILAIIIFNFLLFLTTREAGFLNYCLFQFFYLLVLAAITGLGTQFLWPDSPWLANRSPYLSVFIGVACGLRFTRHFLTLDRYAPLLDKGFAAAIYVSFGLTLASLVMPEAVCTRLAYSTGPAVASAMMVAGILTLWRGNRVAIFYSIAWLTFLGSGIYFGLERLGILKPGPFSNAAFQFGAIAEALLLSLGLGYQFNQMRKEKFLYLKRIQDQEIQKREAELLAEAKKREAEVKAKEAERNQTLVRVISHDLVNPINLILNYVKLGQTQAALLPQTRELWDKVEKASRHQLAIIDHVRELDAVISGKRELKLGPVRLTECIEQVRFLFEKRLAEKSLELVVTGPYEDLAFIADEKSVQYNVIDNLVSNAIKFSPDNGRLHINVRDEEPWVVIEVADQGIGMSPELLRNLFDPTKPTSRQGVRGEKGTGFGMPIVKSYMDSFGGRIEVESRTRDDHPEDHGTKVRLYFKKARRLAKSA